MLFFYTGTDREKARSKMSAKIATIKGAEVVRITDAHTTEDLKVALQGGGMFARTRVLVFEGVCLNPELCDVLLESLEALSRSDEKVFVFEEKPLADLRKRLEKYAETVERFDAPKKERDSSVFALANALKRGDRKALWVGYLREIEKGNAPEMLHGILFWAAKDMYLKSSAGTSEKNRGAVLVSSLAELPHVSRRSGFDLEYALERFVLSIA